MKRKPLTTYAEYTKGMDKHERRVFENAIIEHAYDQGWGNFEGYDDAFESDGDIKDCFACFVDAPDLLETLREEAWVSGENARASEEETARKQAEATRKAESKAELDNARWAAVRNTLKVMGLEVENEIDGFEGNEHSAMA